MNWEWVPVVTAAVFAVFGGIIWNFVRKGVKTINKAIESAAPKADYYSEKYMGDEASNEMWKSVKEIGQGLVTTADKMIALDSFRNEIGEDSQRLKQSAVDLSSKVTEASNR